MVRIFEKLYSGLPANHQNDIRILKIGCKFHHEPQIVKKGVGNTSRTQIFLNIIQKT